MISTVFAFAAGGFLCGLFLRFVGFALVTVAVLVGYIVAQTFAGAGPTSLLGSAIILLIAIQVGYVVALAARTGYLRWRYGTLGPPRSSTSDQSPQRIVSLAPRTLQKLFR